MLVIDYICLICFTLPLLPVYGLHTFALRVTLLRWLNPTLVTFGLRLRLRFAARVCSCYVTVTFTVGLLLRGCTFAVAHPGLHTRLRCGLLYVYTRYVTTHTHTLRLLHTVYPRVYLCSAFTRFDCPHALDYRALRTHLHTVYGLHTQLGGDWALITTNAPSVALWRSSSLFLLLTTVVAPLDPPCVAQRP